MNKSKCIKVKGNQMVNGVIKVSGSKNASLPIICASLFCNGEVTLKNVPDILDIRNLIELLKYINVKCEFNDNVLKINPSKLEYKNLDIPLMKTFRASYYLIPPLLKENSTFKFTSVGGCSFEERPINFHIDLLKERYKQAVEYMAWFVPCCEELSDDERYILDTFYLNEDTKTEAVYCICDYFGIERSSAYRYKDKALEHLSTLLYGK